MRTAASSIHMQLLISWRTTRGCLLAFFSTPCLRNGPMTPIWRNVELDCVTCTFSEDYLRSPTVPSMLPLQSATSAFMESHTPTGSQSSRLPTVIPCAYVRTLDCTRVASVVINKTTLPRSEVAINAPCIQLRRRKRRSKFQCLSGNLDGAVRR